MENLADYGIMGVFLFMTFQYVIKPVMSSFLEKRKGGVNNCNHNPGPELNKVLEILSKCDDKDRPLIWGHSTKEAIDELTKAINNLVRKDR